MNDGDLSLALNIPPKVGATVTNIAKQAKTGDRLKTLEALRDTLAEALDECESNRDRAALSQRLMDCLAEIAVLEKLQPGAKRTPLDELAARRSGDQAQSPAHPAGSRKQRRT